jgi:hypothetical protein
LRALLAHLYLPVALLGEAITMLIESSSAAPGCAGHGITSIARAIDIAIARRPPPQ